MPRYFLVTMIIVVIGIAVIVKAGLIMTVERDFWKKKKMELAHDSLVLVPKRGDILASDGRILATSLNEYVLNLDYMTWEKTPKQRIKDQQRRDSILTTYIDTICQEMHRLFPDINPKKYKRHLLRGRAKESHCWPLYPPEVSSLKFGRRDRKNRQLTYLQLSEIRKLPLFNLRSSLNIEERKMRKNPYGRIAFRTIGEYVNEPRFGLEESFDSVLSGRPGLFHREKVLDAWLSVTDKEAEDGLDIVTTLDIDIQDVVESVLREELTELKAIAGACIVMDVPTGDVKAIASLQHNGNGTYTENEPRAISTHYEPGSVFKPMSFLVAMDDGKVKMTDQVDINGGIYRFGNRDLKDANRRSGGTVGMRDVKFIIQNSSNVGTARLIDQAYIDNPQKFVDGLYRIGVGENLHVPIDHYGPPRICSPKDKHRYWSRTDLPWMSIGYVTQLPPINILNFYNGIANQGKLLRPRFVTAIERNGEVVQEFPVTVLREQMAKPEAVANIQECLKAVVAAGTGKRAASKYFQVAGKTGTAQIWTDKGRTRNYSVTFVGYFPADQPRYSCIVNIQKPGPYAYGWMSGQVFKRVAELIMAKYNEGNYRTARDTMQALLPIVLPGDVSAAGRVLDELAVPHRVGYDTTHTGIAAPLWGMNEGKEDIHLERSPKQSEQRMPDVRGYGLRDAIYLLEDLGLEVRSVGIGQVLHQSIQPGQTYRPGEVIELTLGNKKKRR